MNIIIKYVHMQKLMAKHTTAVIQHLQQLQ